MLKILLKIKFLNNKLIYFFYILFFLQLNFKLKINIFNFKIYIINLI